MDIKKFIRKKTMGRFPGIRRKYETILNSPAEVEAHAVYFRDNEHSIDYIYNYLQWKARHENVFKRIFRAIAGDRQPTAKEFVSFLKGCSVEFENFENEVEKERRLLQQKDAVKRRRQW